MSAMTNEEAMSRVGNLAAGAPYDALKWGAELLVTVSRAGGGSVDSVKAWRKALEVSTRPQAEALRAALDAVPAAPPGLPEDWQSAA